MLLSVALLLLAAVTITTGGYLHCHVYCALHCCPHTHQHNYDCDDCGHHCCLTATHAPTHVTAAPVVFSEWTNCTKECGGGLQYRHCIYNCPIPHMAEEVQDCNQHACPTTTVNGGWSTWSIWTSCSKTCGTGHRSRSRTCDNPSPLHGGHRCHGHHEEGGTCNTATCPHVSVAVDGGWGTWSNWSSCSTTCGTGHRSRTRVCNSPRPQHGGASCHGENLETDTCNTAGCPIAVDGAWGEWSSWSVCSTTCGIGHQIRTHKCNNPQPSNGGHNCHGHHQNAQRCTNANDCSHTTMHPCDKLSVIHALAEIDTTSTTKCLDNWTTETEGFLTEHCNAPTNTHNWHKGVEVLSICQDPSSHLYLPVGTFNAYHYGHASLSGFSGIFVGCNAQHTGFKVATKVCGGVAEVIELPLPASYNHTSTGVIPSDPSVYSFIRWN